MTLKKMIFAPLLNDSKYPRDGVTRVRVSISSLVASLSLMLATLVGFLYSPFTFANQWGYAPDTFSAYVEGSTFSTNQNYDSNGNLTNLGSGNQFNEQRINFSGSYDVSSGFSVWAGGIFKRTDSTTLGFERTNANISDVLLGTDFLLFSGFAKVIPEVYTDIPLYSLPSATQTGSLLGDGAFTVTGKINVTKYIKRFGLSAYGGFTYRNQGLSSLVPFGLAGHLPLRTFFIQAKIYGAFTANGDQYTSQPYYRTAVALAFDGGSFMYDSVNPMFVNIEGDFGWFFTPQFFAKFAVTQTVTGQNSPIGTGFSLGVGFTEDGQTRIHETHSDAVDNGDFELDTESEDVAPRRKNSAPSTAPVRIQAPPPPVH